MDVNLCRAGEHERSAGDLAAHDVEHGDVQQSCGLSRCWGHVLDMEEARQLLQGQSASGGCTRSFMEIRNVVHALGAKIRVF